MCWDDTKWVRGERGERKEWGIGRDEEEKEVRDREVGMAKLLHSVSFSTGGSSIKEYRIASNKQHVLTRDSNGEVEVWDVLHVRESIIGCTGAGKQ